MRDRRGSEIARRVACAVLALYTVGWSLLPIADARFEHRRAEAHRTAELPAADSAVDAGAAHVLCDLINAGAGVPQTADRVTCELALELSVLTPPAHAPSSAPAGLARSRAPPSI